MLANLQTHALKACVPALTAILIQGCTTVPTDEERTQAGVLTDIRNMQEDINRIHGRQDQIETATEDLRKEMRALNSGDTGGKAATEKRLVAMENRLKFIDEAREADKREIIEKLSQKIADVINRTRGGGESAGGRISSSSGVAGETKHVVKEKESLSLIAQKYGVTVDALVQANRLKSANVVRVGQVLVIPR